MYTIDKSIPIPSIANRSEYPFSEMEVGDSFLLPDDESYQKAKTAAKMRNFRNPVKKFRGAIMENGERRIFRIM